jgi:ribosome-binding factor A
MRKNTNRLGRINEELMKEISHVINFELKNPDITGMISVTRVNITPDLRYAKVYISILNTKNLKQTLNGLKESSGFIRSRVANTVNLRITPQLVFEYDDSDVQGAKIDAILKQIHEQDENIKK